MSGAIGSHRCVRWDSRSQARTALALHGDPQVTVVCAAALLPFESQRGEGRLLHGSSAVYDLSILPALNKSDGMDASPRQRGRQGL